MQPRNLDLNELVINLAKMLKRIIGEDVQLQLNLHRTTLMTRADAGMLDQVLMNLSVNARDAMPNGGRLCIETTEETVNENIAGLYPDASPGTYVCVSVSDTGAGIPLEIMPRIFEPFFTTKEAGKGTGLGLATVFGIVKQHHGWIKLDNRPGQGVRFQVFLPASDVKLAETSQATAKLNPRGGTETILLVEDEVSVRHLTCRILKRHGYNVVEANNGHEALALWEKHSQTVALLLTDLVMPGGLSGQELARRLKTDHSLLKVIFTSGYSIGIAGRELKLLDSESFIQKPFTTEQLLETVRRCLDG
jgi:CheY-like chemotaxis protein